MRPDTSAHREPTTCKACGEIIPAAAKKCSHCGSFQSWRAYFPFTQSILALLVALVSVVSMGVPIIKTALQADDSVLTLTYIDRADIAIPIVASNKGTGGVPLDVENREWRPSGS